MTAANFDKTTEWLLIHEGGYVNHPKDPGGATNRGVTQAVYDGYRRRKGKRQQSVRYIEDAEVYDIYRTQYWDKVSGDDLPSGLDYAVYDFAVNSGPRRAVQFLQRIIGVEDDGVMGNVTLGRIRELQAEGGEIGEIGEIIERLCTDRWNWMQTLRTFRTFGRGWTRRVMGDEVGIQDRDTGVIDRAYRMWAQAEVTAPTSEAPGRALEGDEKPTEKIREGFNLDTLGKVAAGVAPGVATAAIQQEGPMQYALAAVVIMAAAMAALVFYKKVIAT